MSGSTWVKVVASGIVVAEGPEQTRFRMKWQGGELDLRNTAALRGIAEFAASKDGFVVHELPGDDDFEKVSFVEVLRERGAVEVDS